MRPPTALVLLAILTLTSTGVPAADTPSSTPPDLSGDWLLNVEQSETLREKMAERMATQSENPRANARWSRMGMRERQMSQAAGFSRLSIGQEDLRIDVRYRDGRTRSLYTDGRELEPEPAYGITKSHATWEGARLVVDSETLRGKQTEHWELSEDGTRLFVTTDVDTGERFGGVLSFRRIYDREPPKPEGAASADPQVQEPESETGEAVENGDG